MREEEEEAEEEEDVEKCLGGGYGEEGGCEGATDAAAIGVGGCVRLAGDSCIYAAAEDDRDRDYYGKPGGRE